MISLRYFVYILFTVCLREASEGLAAPNAGAMLWSVLGSTMGFGLMIKVAAYQVARRVTTDGITQLSDAPIDYQLRRRQIEWLWCLTMPLTMFLCGYLQWTHWIADSVGLPAAGLVFCFLPAILFLFLAEISSAQVDEFLASQFCTTARSGVGWGQALITRLRLGETAGLVTCMFPVILLASVFESSDPVADSLGLSASWLRIPLGICLVTGTLLAMPALMTAVVERPTVACGFCQSFESTTCRFEDRQTAMRSDPERGKVEWGCSGGLDPWIPKIVDRRRTAAEPQPTSIGVSGFA
jgi:hypothetical protein